MADYFILSVMSRTGFNLLYYAAGNGVFRYVTYFLKMLEYANVCRDPYVTVMLVTCDIYRERDEFGYKQTVSLNENRYPIH